MTRRPISPTGKKVLSAGAAIDAALRAVALADLAKRDDGQVNGSKKGWALALSLVSSMGVLPAVYFLKGRRTR